MPDKIVFSDAVPEYGFDQDCLVFNAFLGENRIKCFVTVEFLMARFGADGPSEAAMQKTYEEHREEIWDVARKHIELGWVDDDDHVYLTTRYTRLTTQFGKRFDESSRLLAWAQEKQKILTKIIGPNAEEVRVEWNVEGPQEALCVVLRIIDASLSHPRKVSFGPTIWPEDTTFSLIVGGAWGDVLRARSRKLMLQSG